ncbi:hypothetical protein BHE74_00039495 [Ensete ventricosum]|nr:hypothetical protein GW17_00034836 [Ensete ventricosum]RWW53962.1 hypothetical protein BHE74_00039495 [Ensete ventricosum]RZS13659.1 hypothetical protein BHM03_00045302 [Ensete ventricosum]
MAEEIGQEMGLVTQNRPPEHVVPVGPSERGVYLTWEELSVTASNGSGAPHVILAGLTGYAQPGEVTAIMGPSGCGKSTLLDALAGRLGSSTRRSGHILVNGRRQRLSFGTSVRLPVPYAFPWLNLFPICFFSFVSNDLLRPVYYSAELQLPKTMTKSEKRERADMTIREMGLQDAMDTRIGGYSSKGISGGQKRRVSICVEILTRPKLLFLDEPTSGLDSAASYHIMHRIVNLARHDGMTILASIHQPSSEVFELFDNLCLLSSGRTVYFGPTSRTNAVSPHPSQHNICDIVLADVIRFFLEADESCWSVQESEEGCSERSTNANKAIDVLTMSYKQSETCKDVARRVSEICNVEGDLVKNKRQASFAAQCVVLTKRSFVNMYRDLGYYWLRLAIYIMLCLCIGTVFYDVGLSYGSIQKLNWARRHFLQIFRRERLNGHYGVAAFVISNTLSSAPYLALVSLLPAAMAYYLAGLQRGLEHFIFFSLVLYMCMLLVEGLMMIVASIVPNFLMGIITGAGIQAVMILSSGFFRLPRDLPKPVWKYPVYHIAFHKYANQGYFKNEFIGLTFPGSEAGGAAAVTGETVVRDYWQMEVGYSKWVDLAILFAMVILYRLLFLVIIKMSEKAKPILMELLNAPPKKVTQVMEQPLEDDTEPNP